MKAQQNKLSGYASNLLSHEDLGLFEKPIVGIYKLSSIMKIPTSIWKWQNKRLSIIKIMVLLWSTSVEKRIVALPLFIYFIFFGPFFFLFGLSLFLGQCSINDDHHTSIYLQLNDYNSILEQNMTLYECLRRCTGICNESRVTWSVLILRSTI